MKNKRISCKCLMSIIVYELPFPFLFPVNPDIFCTGIKIRKSTRKARSRQKSHEENPCWKTTTWRMQFCLFHPKGQKVKNIKGLSLLHSFQFSFLLHLKRELYSYLKVLLLAKFHNPKIPLPGFSNQRMSGQMKLKKLHQNEKKNKIK